MSVLAKMRRAFGGGVSASMDLPQDFAWEDRVIPVTVHLSSHPSQADTTVRLRFHLFDEEQGTRSNSGTENGLNHRWEMEDAVVLASGSSQALSIQMPLPFDVDAIREAIAQIDQGVSIGDRVTGSLMLGTILPPTHLVWYRLSLAVKAEGALLPARASGKLRNRDAKARRFSLNPFQR